MRWASEQQARSAFRLCTYISVALLAACAQARADGAIDAWASWALAPKVWKGQTVLAPELAPRPSGAFAHIVPLDAPLCLQLPAATSAARAERIARASVEAYALLREIGWPLPAPDGGRGDSTASDVYVVPRAQCSAACAFIDADAPLSDFDAADTFAEIADDVPASQLPACAQSALAQAGLRAIDPAEAESWVRASAELSVWLASGRFGCEDALLEGQRAPELGFLNADPASASGGALWLGVLDERVHGNDRTPGAWLRSLWESTRQRSRGLVDPDRLRSSPDLWEVLKQTLEAQHLALEDELIEFEVARYFAGPAARKAQAPYRLLAALPSDAGVPVTRELRAAESAAHLHDLPALHSLGSAYVRVALPADLRRRQLQVWLRGELGPRWSLTAVRLDANGRELGRTSAPPRDQPSAYIPVALDQGTSQVVLVIASLPRTTPDADLPLDEAHGYELIVGLGD
jgi:hypothetical protein